MRGKTDSWVAEMAEIPGESRDYRPIKSVISRTNRRHIATHIIRWELK